MVQKVFPFWVQKSLEAFKFDIKIVILKIARVGCTELTFVMFDLFEKWETWSLFISRLCLICLNQKCMILAVFSAIRKAKHPLGKSSTYLFTKFVLISDLVQNFLIRAILTFFMLTLISATNVIAIYYK